MSEFNTYRFPLSEVLPTPAQACDYLHLSADMDDPAYSFVCQQLQELGNGQTFQSIGGYRVQAIDRIDVAQGLVHIGEGRLQCGRQVAGYLQGSDYAALFLCTAGAVFSERTRAFTQNGDQLKAYLCDALGSLSVENAMDRIQRLLEEKCQARGWNITNRYSPGYCNWPLSDQKPLFSLIGDNPCGISLNDSCLMYPIKSVSGIMGLGSGSKKRPYGCAICQNKTCIYRHLVQKTTH